MRNSTRPVLALALAAVLAFSSSAAALAKGKTPPVTNPMDFARWTSLADWNSGTFDHIMPVMTGDPAGNGGLVLDPADGLLTGTDTAGMYNSGDYYYGTYTTPVVVTDIPFNWAVASWDATTPEGTWLQLEMTAQKADGTWTKWYNMGVWAFETVTVRRHSVYGQADKDGTVDTDTLKLGKAAVAYQCRLTLFTADPALTPQVNLISVIVHNTRGELTAMTPDRSAWGIELAVPERSQMDYLPEGSAWCSPTATSMVMEYWAGITGNSDLNQTVPAIAARCRDYGYGGTGNWPFNTAAAAGYGLEAYVSRFQSLSQIEQWIKAGVPVVIGIQFKKGDLTGAPILSTSGHLILVRGFDENGNVICNDPAATYSQGEDVRVVYIREELEAAWLGANGIVYLIYPAGHPTPADPRGSW